MSTSDPVSDDDTASAMTVCDKKPKSGNSLDVLAPAPSEPGRPRWVSDAFAIVIAAALMLAAVLIPLYGSAQLRLNIFVLAPPLFGILEPHGNYSTAVAVAIGIAVIAFGPWVARVLGWKALLTVTYLVALAWTISLAFIDGWTSGFTRQLQRPDEYLPTARAVTSIPSMLSHFSSRILDYQPDSWPTHVSGHPAGALLSFVVLDRIGLGSGAGAATFVVIVGASMVVAVLITLRRLAGADAARRAAPFLAVTPGAVWMGVSADGYYMGVVAWGIALVAISATTSRQAARVSSGLGGGVLLGFGIFCNYGLTLMGVIALAVLLAARQWWPLVYAVIGALVVVGVFAAAGFWWLDGYHLVYERYYQGIASQRPYSYWVWANFASSFCAIGPAAAIGLSRCLRYRPLRRREAVVLLGCAGFLAMILADLSGLSKAETERIWLPFGAWILTSTALIPPRHQRFWLVAQVFVALLVNSLVRTHW